MNPYGWQHAKKITIPAGGSITVELPASRPILDKLTLWATTGARTTGAAAIQPRINGANFGAAGAITGPDSVVALRLDDVASGVTLLPAPNVATGSRVPTGNEPDGFTVDFVVTGTVSDQITLYWVGVGYAGGN
ncbi:MAG TPA: hypothetical protein VFH61_00610 [Thermoleophilia bacterium]|nr:hypothetical protein [Thermoleophilia bacterium]